VGERRARSDRPLSASPDRSTPRRIALAIESSGPGGAENMVLRLARALRDAGDEPRVVTLRPGWMTDRAEADGLPVWIVPQREGLDPLWVPRFAARLRRERIDVLHSHEFAMNVFGGAAAWLARVPSVATVHGHAWVTGAPRRTRAYRVLRRLGMPLVAVSHDLAGFLAAGLGIPRSAIEVIHNGIPVPPRPEREGADERRRAARAELGLPADGPLLVAVGNLYPVKDHATLVRAAAELAGARVAIAGRGEEEEPLRKLANEVGLGARLHLLGLRDDVDRVLAAGDVFVQPSRSEGLPLAVLEAMAAGCPVVASGVGGMPEAIVDGETGHLVPPSDPPALARALGRVLESADGGFGLGLAGWERVRAEFSVERMTERYRARYADPRPARAAR